MLVPSEVLKPPTRDRVSATATFGSICVSDDFICSWDSNRDVREPGLRLQLLDKKRKPGDEWVVFGFGMEMDRCGLCFLLYKGQDVVAMTYVIYINNEELVSDK